MAVKTFPYDLIKLDEKYDDTRENRHKILKFMLEALQGKAKKECIKVEKFYKTAIKLSSDPHPHLMNGGVGFDYKDIYFCFKGEKGTKEEPIDFTKSYFSLKMEDSEDQNPEGMEFHLFSMKAAESLSQYDVMTFYITIVVFAGRLIRGFIMGEAEKIILTEMPKPKKLLNLCEGIKISRYRNDFEKEEYYYYVLVDLMRSPELLRIVTKTSIQNFEDRRLQNRYDTY